MRPCGWRVKRRLLKVYRGTRVYFTSGFHFGVVFFFNLSSCFFFPEDSIKDTDGIGKCLNEEFIVACLN